MTSVPHSGAKSVRCGDCQFFVRDGSCNFLQSEAGRDKSRPFAHAPFWVWSDCYSDREQVRSGVTSACPTYAAISKATAGETRNAEPIHRRDGDAESGGVTAK